MPQISSPLRALPHATAPQPPTSWRRLTVLELAGVRVAIGKRVGTLAVDLAVLERAGVRAAIGERDPAQRRPQYL